jgi:two-component system, chemotaxis family, CheB/CheR fusion protein
MEKSITDKPLIKSPNLFPVVGVGASAGGLDAFKKLLKAIPENSGMAYVLVQHLDPNHESLLAELLQKVTTIPVLEIADDIKVEPNHVYIIPSNKMLLANDGILELSPRPQTPKNKQNLPIDLFFTSLAEVHQSHAIGVVLSGTANDGTAGLKAIKDYGGITFAQDEASAAYPGMPTNAIEAGVVDFILSPDKIPGRILEVTQSINGHSNDEKYLTKPDEDLFKQIISLLRIRKGTDFTYYKQTTIHRRIRRRMVITKNTEPVGYLNFLRENKPEQDLLYQDLLIPVTTFFRDEKSFENLCETVLPAIVKSKTAGEAIRVWVAGCSTGEEAYSIAICFKEILGEGHERVQIFGTDLSEPAITKARSANYTKAETDNVTPQRLNEFFTKAHGGYQLHKSIRDMCVFATHNFLKDPPFGKMDLISCRNVLIYMEPYLQKKALTTFHYSLLPKGFLLLGKSETTSGVPDLFASAAKNDKLFTRKDVPGRFMHVATQRSEQILSRSGTDAKNEPIRTDFQKTADDILLSRYTPASVVVNEVMDIVHFRGSTSYYLEQAAGKPTHNLLMMAKDGLAFELRNILHKAKKEKSTVTKENIPLQVNGNMAYISLEAIPLPHTIEPYYLILFHLNTATANLKLQPPGKTSAKAKKDNKDIRILQLEQELAQARDDMRSITEDQEASNEELQSANEELLSSGEEMQSLNEELETNKEELQSTNEELTVVNQEMQSLNEQITKERDYAEAIVATVREPLLVLDKHLRLKTANNAFYKTFHLTEQDAEGKLIYDIANKQWNIPELQTLLENILPEKTMLTDYEIKHSFANIGERIMLLNAREMIKEHNTEKLILLAI